MAENYIDKDQCVRSRTATIMAYFRKPDEDIKSFQSALKGLTDVDKDELADGSAREMGWVVKAS